jgi:hypothetical protein
MKQRIQDLPVSLGSVLSFETATVQSLQRFALNLHRFEA